MFKRKKLNDNYWNYRIIEKNRYYKNELIATYYELAEVYYDENGKPFAWSDDVSMIFENKKDYKIFMKQIKNATRNKLMFIENGVLQESNRYLK